MLMALIAGVPIQRDKLFVLELNNCLVAISFLYISFFSRFSGYMEASQEKYVLMGSPRNYPPQDTDYFLSSKIMPCIIFVNKLFVIVIINIFWGIINTTKICNIIIHIVVRPSVCPSVERNFFSVI